MADSRINLRILQIN